MTPIRWLSRDPAAVPHVAELPPVTAAAAGWELAATQRALWVGQPDRAARLEIPGPWTVVALADGLMAWSAAGAEVSARASLEIRLDPDRRASPQLAIGRSSTGPWTLEGGPELPSGARWSESLRPLVTERGLAWADSGFVYLWRLDAAPEAIGRGSELHFDRAGAVHAGPAPVASPPQADPPADATRHRTQIAGIGVFATRTEGDTVRGWARDGAVVVDQLSSGNS